jgi:hypothetical protein
MTPPPPQSDDITQLPSTKSPPTHEEIHMVEEIFGETPTVMDNLVRESRDVLLVGILFIFFSIEPVTQLFHKALPFTSNSIYLCVFVKTLFIMVFWWLIKHFYLSRRKKVPTG